MEAVVTSSHFGKQLLTHQVTHQVRLHLVTMPNNILQPKYFLVMQILCLCVKLGSKHTTVIVFLTLTGFGATGWIDVNVEVVVYVCMYVREHINISRVQAL